MICATTSSPPHPHLPPRAHSAASHGYDGLIATMDGVARLLLRFILVPFGYFAGVLAGSLVILFGSWKIGQADALDVEAHAIAVYRYVFAAPVLLVILPSVMWLPAATGVLLAETFALRSWMFHAGNGAVSAWIAWNLFGYMDNSRVPLNGPAA